MSSGSEWLKRMVLDTSAYSRLLRRHAEVLDLVSAASQIFVSTISLGELEAGFELGSKAAQNRRTLGCFLEESYVEVVRVDEEIARHYGRIFARLRRAGKPLPTNDIWIAATAAACRCPVLTFDRHFLEIAELEVEVLDTPQG